MMVYRPTDTLGKALFIPHARVAILEERPQARTPNTPWAWSRVVIQMLPANTSQLWRTKIGLAPAE